MKCTCHWVDDGSRFFCPKHYADLMDDPDLIEYKNGAEIDKNIVIEFIGNIPIVRGVKNK